MIDKNQMIAYYKNMAFLKKILLFYSFFLFFAINLYLVGHIYVNYVINQKQQKILGEINGLKKNMPGSISAFSSKILGVMDNEIKLADARASNLRNFFGKYHSPLYDIADHIVIVSDKYGFDYRLLPAIAMQESGLCKHAPDQSYNCWGYGIYGQKTIRFNSFEEAVDAVAKDIRENYLDKGYTTPELIMNKYTPRSNGSWARSINFFITSLE